MCLFYATTWNINANLYSILNNTCRRTYHIPGVAPLNIKPFSENHPPSSRTLGTWVGATSFCLATLTRAFNSHTWITLQGYFRLLHKIFTEGRKKKSPTTSVCARAACSGLKWNTMSCWLLQALQSQHNAITNPCSGLEIDFTATVCKYSATQFVQHLHTHLPWCNLWMKVGKECPCSIHSFVLMYICKDSDIHRNMIHIIQGHGICQEVKRICLWSHQLILFEGQES